MSIATSSSALRATSKPSMDSRMSPGMMVPLAAAGPPGTRPITIRLVFVDPGSWNTSSRRPTPPRTVVATDEDGDDSPASGDGTSATAAAGLSGGGGASAACSAAGGPMRLQAAMAAITSSTLGAGSLAGMSNASPANTGPSCKSSAKEETSRMASSKLWPRLSSQATRCGAAGRRALSTLSIARSTPATHVSLLPASLNMASRRA
mmetsp:Transcript_16470/g.44800  ORF Transcript_16470/g.44800 Transcript_16470/m.44800 type:complete len:206 (-) Transcript_16470:1622-2239(-)